MREMTFSRRPILCVMIGGIALSSATLLLVNAAGAEDRAPAAAKKSASSTSAKKSRAASSPAPKTNANKTSSPSSSPWKYPMSRKSDHVDVYHGTSIPDPYRWMEEPDSDDTKKWIEAQNRLTFSVLEKIPARRAIRRRLTNLWNYERLGTPFQKGGKYFFTKNDGLQNQNVLYTAESLSAEPRVLLDPNKLTKDGTVALAGVSVSDDGRLLAYGFSTAGSDWQEWRVRDVATGKDQEDHIRWVKFSSASWTPDGKSFFYSRYDEPAPGTALTGANYFQKLYFHKLGAPQSEDQLVYERKDHKEWGFDGHPTEDGRYLVINVWRGSERKNLLFYKPLPLGDEPVVELFQEFDAEYDFLGNVGSTFYIRTDKDAPRTRVLAVDLNHPEKENWKTIIPESEDSLESVSLVGHKLFANYLHHAHNLVKIHSLEGKLEGEVALPGLGSISGFGGKQDDLETFYSFTGFTSPTAIYRYDIPNNKSQLWHRPKVDFPSEKFETKQVFYAGKDGTRVPMFITHKKGLKLDGRNPTLLYGYGGFNISITPGFSVKNAVWMEMGGVYAVPNLRGGGEYGREWHEAGMKEKKQNVFDDFLSAAQWLIDNKYTSSPKLAISGGSNGGLLVGACMTQQPELFGAALPSVGVMDMLRYHRYTIGWAWMDEFGSSDDAAQFHNLLRYSPLHNLKEGKAYPPTLITTGDHDDRVVPAHSFKFAARLQEVQSGENPVLIRIETKAGHGAGKPVTKQIEEASDVLGFLTHALKFDPTLNGE